MTRKSARQASEEERALFVETVREARPTLAPASPKAAKAAPAPKASATRNGVDGRTAERLRKGLIEPEARLDLHGLTEQSAHRALTVFLREAQARGCRLAVVITGKGKPVAPDAPFDMEQDRRARGILKSIVPRWLAEPSLAAIVAVTREAHRKHGGAGALYVYLRKPDARR